MTSSLNEQEELKKMEADIAHYKEKYELQQKRLELLKK